MDEQMAPAKNVFPNCNLLIKQAIMNTQAAIVKGTGKLVLSVRT